MKNRLRGLSKVNFHTRYSSSSRIARKKTSTKRTLFIAAVIPAIIFSLIEPGVNLAVLLGLQRPALQALESRQALDFPAAADANNMQLSSPTLLAGPGDKGERKKQAEDKSLRTSNTKTFINSDGSRTLEYSVIPKHYRENENWLDLIESERPDDTYRSKSPIDDEGSVSNPISGTPAAYKLKAGKVTSQLRPFAEGLEVRYGDKVFTVTPNKARNVRPTAEQTSGGIVYIYKNAWSGVDVEYELLGNVLKETIIIKNANAPETYSYSFAGATIKPHSQVQGAIAIDGIPEDEFLISPLTVNVSGRGVISEEVAVQTVRDGNVLDIRLQDGWLKSLPRTSFPVAIDPSFYNDVGGTYGNFIMYKSDGYQCGNQNCDPQAGTLYDYGWKHWRTMFRIPFDQLQGKTLLSANLHLVKKQRSYYTGTNDGRWFNESWAPCFGFGCTNGASSGPAGVVGTDNWLDVRHTVQWMINNGQWGGWFILWGEEGGFESYKQFEPTHLGMSVTYDTPTPIASPVAPGNGGKVVTTQPSLRVNTVTDADGDAVKYYFRLSTNPDAETGAIVNSGWVTTPQWTIPDGILQDGVTYYWHTYTHGYHQTNPNWVRSFTVDLRKGKDSTQSYDTVGPVSVDLATGNMTTGSSTHSIAALGGGIGVGLEYNSPTLSQPGLVGQYWNNANLSGTPTLTRTDSNIDFVWSTGSPAAGLINQDYFSARWTGYFKAPQTGSYQLGCEVDDGARIWLKNQLVLDAWGWCGARYGAAVELQAGEVVPIKVEYNEAPGAAMARLWVRGIGADKIVPSEWLSTGVRPSAQQYGLTGKYYVDDGSHNFPSDSDPGKLLMVREDQKISFNWGAGAPAAGLRTDNFMVRWKGYLTVPTSGNYTLGASGDDGIRIKLGTGVNNSDETVLNTWHFASGNRWGSVKYLQAGKLIPYTVEFFEQGGGAAINLVVRGDNLPEQELPASWLTSKSHILPVGWQASLDINGSVAYERLRINTNSVILSDASGGTHEYTWTGSGYKPPVNQEGVLNKNTDGSFTLLDVDGRTYVFAPDGSLTSVTKPQDDRSPTALRYEYEANPSRLKRIIDGVTPSRYGELVYAGDSACSSRPSGFEATPAGMLCAYKTTDGQQTNFYYKSGRLSRIQRPGDEVFDFGYDEFGRIVSMRDAPTTDAIRAGFRLDNTTVNTEIQYDAIGRVSSISPPAPLPTATKGKHSFVYGPNSTTMHIHGAPEPHGFSKRVEYDHLFRTKKYTDVANLSVSTEWHPDKDLVLSSTDAANLKSTNIYDSSDRVTDVYGPAPQDAFKADRTPIDPSTIAHVRTSYDAGHTGVAAQYFPNKSFAGDPKRVATHIWNGTMPVTVDHSASNLPVSSSADGWSARYTGKIDLTEIGNYSFRVWGDGGVRLWIDDQLYIDSWASGGARNHVSFRNFTKLASDPTKLHRFRIDQHHAANVNTNLHLFITAPGKAETGLVAPRLTTNYGLVTDKTSFDARFGDSTTKTNYSNLEYGLIGSTVVDPAGLNLTATATFEQPGSAFLRQLDKTLPGGGSVAYEYWGKDSTQDDPCTSTVESFRQAGMLKHRTEADPDGNGPETGRRSETIYNDSGQVVASRFNNDPWSCTSYDARGRVTSTRIPARGDKEERVIINNWAVDGNPLKISSGDHYGYITTLLDLQGRVVAYTDTHGITTTTTYDDLGRLIKRQGPLGTEEYIYDAVDRLIEQKLDGVTLATPHYDAFGRLVSVDYPTAGSQKLEAIQYDAYGHTTSLSYRLGDGTTATDSRLYSQSGKVISSSRTVGADTLNSSYVYDKSSRLTSAVIGADTYTYGYGTQNSSCDSSTNPNAGKNGNRTSSSINNVSTFYCYDYANRLKSSTDPELNGATYDGHGNMTKLGTEASPLRFTYDASDRNTALEQFDDSGNGVAVYYLRDVQGRITERYDDTIRDWEWITESGNLYGYTGSGDTPDYVMDANYRLKERYIGLPGGVLLTMRAEETVHSIPNLHGDIFVTTDARGNKTGQYDYDPFGNPTGQSPTNSTTGSSLGWVGKDQRLTESRMALAPIQMGARVYIPKLGRFAQVDPLEGGAANAYAYPLNPVSSYDLTGMAEFLGMNPAEWGIAAITTVGIAACVAATAGICAGAVGTVVVGAGIGGLGGAASYAVSSKQDKSLGEMGVSASIGAGSAAAGAAVGSFVNRLIAGNSITKVAHAFQRKGAELKIPGTNLRASPLGNRNATGQGGQGVNWGAALPHFHNMGAATARLRNLHHPWETSTIGRAVVKVINAIYNFFKR